MRTVHRFALAGMLLVLATALPLVAQDSPEQADVIEQLQGKGVLADEDTAALRTWVEQQVQTLAADDPGVAATAARDLRRSYKGTPAFQQAYVSACTDVIGAGYQRAQRDVAARLIAVLNTLNEPATHAVLIEALGDQRVPVRAVAAIGLRNLQAKLAGAGGDALADTIAALRDAGKREESHVALQLIYRALDFGAAPSDPKATAAALLDMLDARGGQYGTRDVKAEGADRVGLKLAGRLAGQLDDDGRRRLAIATAKMLHYAVTRYTGDLHKIDDKTSSPLRIALRNRMELFIEAAETLLVQLVQPAEAPTITQIMQTKPAGDKHIDMKSEWIKWAELLQQAYQIDLQLDVSEEDAAAEQP